MVSVSFLALIFGICLSAVAMAAPKDDRSAEVAIPEFCLVLLSDAQEHYLERVTKLDARLATLEGQFRRIPRSLSGFEPEQTLNLIVKHREALNHAFESWDGSPPAAENLRKTLTVLSVRTQKLEELQNLCQERFCTTSFEAVRGEPMLLMPNRIYEVNTDRGGVIKVRFSRDVVETFFWENRSSKVMDAAAKALEAVGRGFTPDSARGASGIGLMAFDMPPGQKWVKIHIIGNAIGSIRVYGVLKNDIFNFVLVEDSSEHDSRFLARARNHTIDRFEREKWK